MKRLLCLLLAGCGTIAAPKMDAPLEPAGKTSVRANEVTKGAADRIAAKADTWKPIAEEVETFPVFEHEGVPSITIPSAIVRKATESAIDRSETIRTELEAIRKANAAQMAAFDAAQLSSVAQAEAKDKVISDLKGKITKLESESHKFARFLIGACLVIAVASLIGSAWFKPLAAISGNAAGAALGIRAWISADGFMSSIGWWLGAAIVGCVGWWLLHRYHKAPPPETPVDPQEKIEAEKRLAELKRRSVSSD